MRRLLAACLMLDCAAYGISQPRTPDPSTIQERYRAIEVNSFEVEAGVDFPPHYFARLQGELIKQLQEKHLFEAVLKPDEQPPRAEMPVLRLTGVVTKFKEGSRAKRYFVGFGAGTSQIFAHARYIDRESGQTVIEAEVIGTLNGGLFGGDTKNVIHQFAASVVTTTQLMLLKKPVAEKAVAVLPASTGNAADAPEQTTLEITHSDLDARQKVLNDLAEKGFRIVRYASTSSKSATITLEKRGDASQEHKDLMMQTQLPGTLQKELNKAAAEGYRLVPHTLGFLKGYFLIAEKGAPAPGVQYEYRLHVTMRVSSAEKNVREDQAQGFVLIDTSQVQNSMHMIVLEREIPRQMPVTLD